MLTSRHNGIPGCLNFSQFSQIYPNAPVLKFVQNTGMNLDSPVSPRVKIIVVDDHPNTAALLARAISKLGNRVEVVSATSGHEALERVQRDAADILITDMDMPDMTGLELIKRLRPSTGRPILSFLITAASIPELDLIAHQLNVKEVLRKPIHPQKICQLISQVLEEMDLSEPDDTSIHEQQRLAAVLRHAADAILMFDANGYLVLANPASQKLFKDYEVRIGQRLTSGSRYDCLLSLLDQTRLSGASFTGEVLWSDHRVFSASATPVPEGGVVIILHDVTRFKDLERIKNGFIATASHDLRSPITSIQGFNVLIRRAGPLNESQHEFVQRIQNAAETMEKLVERMLDLAKMDLGVERDFELLDISPLIWEMENEFQPQADAKRLLLVVGQTEPNSLIHGDGLKVRQALRNLIGNAIKYTSPGGVIMISLGHEAGMANVKIHDTGYGIPREHLLHIFNRFYRITNPRQAEIDGNGLGLAIVKSIADEHCGDVTVESEVGKGSCFTLKLPLMQAENRTVENNSSTNIEIYS